MTSAIKRLHNLPYLSFYTTWHYRKTEMWHWRAEALTLATVFLRASSTKHWLVTNTACMHV